MLFTVSRALRVCKNLPDSDIMFMKLTEILRSSVDHLNAYEDFTGLTLVGHETEVVDFEEWINGPRNNDSIEITMLDLGYRLRLADPTRQYQQNAAAPPPNLMMMLADHQRRAADVGGGVVYSPSSPVYMPVMQQGGGDGGAGVQIPIPIPVPTPLMGAPIAVVTTNGPMSSNTPLLGGGGGIVVARHAPPHRVDSVEHLFVPDEVV